MNNTNCNCIQDLQQLMTGPNNTPAVFQVHQKVYGRRFVKIDATGNELSSSFKLSQLTKDVFSIVQHEPKSGFMNKEAATIMDAIELIEKLDKQKDPNVNKLFTATSRELSHLFGFFKKRNKILARINRQSLANQKNEYLTVDIPTKQNTDSNKSIYGNRYKRGYHEKMIEIFNAHYGQIDLSEKSAKESNLHFNTLTHIY